MIELSEGSVRVGIADASAVIAPGSIATIGLGSCIGILLYDETKKIAALAHIMLPDSNAFRNVTNPYKFADLAVPSLLDEMKKFGTSRKNVIAKIVGGASMFKFTDKAINSEIGLRNIEAVKQKLSEEKINIIGEDVGGNKGRTMIVEAETGSVIIKIAGGIVNTI